MANHAERCPVCGGEGKVERCGDGSESDASTYEETCHGCKGKGWIIVSDVTLPPMDVTYVTNEIGEDVHDKPNQSGL